MLHDKGFPIFDESSKMLPLSIDSLIAAKKELQKQKEINKHILYLARLWHNSKNN
jgi:hypothetical protein